MSVHQLRPTAPSLMLTGSPGGALLSSALLSSPLPSLAGRAIAGPRPDVPIRRTRSRPDQERTKLDGSGRTGRAAATQVGAMTRIRPVPRAAICSQRATAGTAAGGGTGRPARSRMTAPAAASARRDTR